MPNPPRTPSRRRRPSLSLQAAAAAVMAWALSACASAADDSAAGDVAHDSATADMAAGVCDVAADCPAPSGPCLVRACSAGQCLPAAAADGSPCDDGDLCTDVSACAQGACVGPRTCCSVHADCAAADDGDLCNGVWSCDLAADVPRCVPTPHSAVVCDTSLDAACQVSTCQPATGACVPVARADSAPCDDGSACTIGDACQAGACSGTSTCACQVDVDCQSREDGDLCNGTLYCDTKAHVCKVNPATVVVCAASSVGPCQVASCQPKTGACAAVPKADGSACELDGSPCTPDVCAGGTCQAGAVAASCACTQTSDCAVAEDGDLCNGTLFCNKATATCQPNPATVVTCPSVDDTACRKRQCTPLTGACAWVDAPDGAPCDDGWTCSPAEVCKGGLCVAPGSTCACTTSADCAGPPGVPACSQRYCDKVTGQCKVNPATIQVCAPMGDPACAKTACDAKAGICAMTATNPGGPCDADGNACTGPDLCAAGVCVPGPSLCACMADADCAASEDGDTCNGTLYCDKPKGTCQINPATVPSCVGAGDGPCKPLQCVPKDGSCQAVALPNGATCSDGDACTQSDACAAGVCAGAPLVCGDGAVCQLGTCVAGCAAAAAAGGSLGCSFVSLDLDHTDDATGGADKNSMTAPHALLLANPNSSDAKVTLAVSPPFQLAATQVVVPAGKSLTVPMPVMNIDGNSLTAKAIVVTSTTPIAAFQLNPGAGGALFSGDATLLLPGHLFGQEYVVATVPSVPTISGFNFPSQRGYLTVVATATGTTKVTVMLSSTAFVKEAPVTLQPIGKGETAVFSLEQHQVLNLEGYGEGAAAPDMTGTRVLADKPVAVFSGHEQAGVTWSGGLGDTCCAEHIEEQLAPVAAWDTTWFAAKSKPRGDEADIWLVLASAAGTQLSTVPAVAGLDGATLAGPGAWLKVESKASFLLLATKPVQLVQFTVGGHQTTAVVGDPTMIAHAPMARWRKDYVVVVPPAYAQNYATVVRPKGVAVTLDDAPVADGAFAAVANGAWELAWLPVTAGLHRVKSAQPCGLVLHGYGTSQAYGMAGGR